MRLVSLIAAALPLAACSLSDGDTGTPGTGPGSSRSYALADFTGVALRGSDDADIRVGTGFSVHAEGPAKELDRLRIVRDGDTLKIGRVAGTHFSWGGHDAVTVYVTMPRIVAAATAGSGDLKIDRVEGNRFSATTAGSGGIDIAALTARAATLALAGSGDVSAKGSVGTLDVSVAGSGNVDASGLKATSADVSVAGSGNVRAAVSGNAKVAVMGSGDVDLGPAAHCTTTKLGSGTVHCGG